ncbi:putative pentatricopeptide repeat-containing protein At5g08490 [Sesamum indicum]|uniref:Pentatricopeptide repeat-containing protein At5g08490 n=1 Tax=Sesamum indicum TaxID=4182 RepID=A0A6I9U049_SESIN|nr:putative pentatricopeptide repeat-containing protein At5g08490 [Sesamum indicum]XP_020552766.1 putative pentatricopeptide repeat-containing protein At5g08490 [Sesamum indicum]XP_020552767.1 putative pentatricopeptide repeat-containing protein At5g08490 [Sesamum indicum]XP_020552768.1 putative pentatricopeptide repeat-containing protein At5g08490 [Sesamum indicum]XP_020552769.1 putative pentatricopeptide repeat-containing protein At5g08490 [Sesamum indicum]
MSRMSEALSLVLQRTHYLTNSRTSFLVFADVLKSCAAMSDTHLGKSLHGQVIKQGHDSCPVVLKALLNMYAKCKALEDCQKLFGELNGHDTVTWNILLSGFAGSRFHDYNVMRLFNMLHAASDLRPSPISLAIVLPVYARSGTQDAGKSMHAYAIKSGMETQTLVGNALVSMYAKCGLVLDASAIFRGIADKDVVSYNAVIAGLAENKLVENAFELFHEMIEGPVLPNYATIANILPICAGFGDTVGHILGKEIHCYVLRRTELENEIMIINALLSFYLRIGRIREAESLFGRMKLRDMVSWNTIIAGYASNGQWWKSLEAFREFVNKKMIGLDAVTLISILPVCTQLCNLQVGKMIHGYVLRHPALHEDTSIGNALINFYAKCCYMAAAFHTFSLIPQKDVISWNTMLDAFGVNLLEKQFADLLSRMFVDGMRPDAVTILTVVQFCASLSRVKNVKEAHGFSLRLNLLLTDGEPTLGNALLDAYAKSGNMEYASKMFENLSGKRNVVTCNSMISGYLTYGSYYDANIIFEWMSERDLTTWNLMVRGYAQNECPSEALKLFHELQSHGIRPDATTIMSILPVCGQMASVHFLRQCHGYAVRACFEDAHLKAALLDGYSKCGSISSAYKLYQSTLQKDLVVFTAMVGGFAMHGMGKEAIRVFDYMLECGIIPDHVVITAVLSACRHAGLINEGLMIFSSINQVHHMNPSIEQYACVVDLLGRGGRINEAFFFINQMPIAANSNIWGALLGACKTHHDVDMGNVVADHLLKIETGDIGNYVVLSNLYAADARWDGVSEMRRLMKMRDLKKPAGCSWIEVERSKNIFIAGDCSHPKRNLIYSMLSHLDEQIKELKSPYI